MWHSLFAMQRILEVRSRQPEYVGSTGRARTSISVWLTGLGFALTVFGFLMMGSPFSYEVGVYLLAAGAGMFLLGIIIAVPAAVFDVLRNR